MEQKPEPLQIPIIGENKISYRLNKITCIFRCCDVFSIIMNFSVWIFLILIIITVKRKQESFLFLFFGAFSYLIYFILEMISITFKYLKIKDNGIIYEKMGDIYKTNPSISLVGESYHYEGRDGNVKVSHKEEIPFNYTFCRDVSGNFNLNINKNNYKYKYYVILNIAYEVIFDDDLLFNDYNIIKNEIIDKNKNRDKYFEYIDNIELKGINNLMMVKLDDKEPWFVGCFWFVIFNILSLASLYRLYIWIISIEQTVTIKKLITKRNNNLPYDERYNIYNPSLQFLDKIFTYNQNNNISEKNSVDGKNNFQTNIHINDNQQQINSDNNMNDNNINNEQLNTNNITIHVYQNNPSSKERCMNKSNQEK